MKRTLLIITDERPEYLARTVASAAKHLPPFDRRLMMDDSGNPEFARYLDVTYPDFEIHHNEHNLGRAATMRKAWNLIAESDADFVFHLQNDFVFTGPVPLNDIQAVLERKPRLAQVALLRQPWNDAEKAAGSIYAKDGIDRYFQRVAPGRDGLVYFLEQTIRWTDNPSLFPADLCRRLPYPVDANVEGGFSDMVRAAGYVCGYWGTLTDPPRCEHIGYRSFRHESPSDGRMRVSG